MVPLTPVKQQRLWLKDRQNCQQATVEGADPASLCDRLTRGPELQQLPGEAEHVPAKPLAINGCGTRACGQDVSQEAATAGMCDRPQQRPGEQPGCASPKRASA